MNRQLYNAVQKGAALLDTFDRDWRTILASYLDGTIFPRPIHEYVFVRPDRALVDTGLFATEWTKPWARAQYEYTPFDTHEHATTEHNLKARHNQRVLLEYAFTHHNYLEPDQEGWPTEQWREAWLKISQREQARLPE